MREWRLYAQDIEERCVRMANNTRGLNREQFIADQRTYDAVVRNLEIIGEAAKYIPEEIRVRAAEIPGREHSRFRDLIAQEYFGLNDDVLLKAGGQLLIIEIVPHENETFRAAMADRHMGIDPNWLQGQLVSAGFAEVRHSALASDPRADHELALIPARYAMSAGKGC